MINLDTFTEKFSALFDLSPSESVEPNTKFTTLSDWGSLTLIMTIALLQTEFEVNFTNEDITGCESVQDLFKKAIASSGAE